MGRQVHQQRQGVLAEPVAPEVVREFHTVLNQRTIETVFQPIVDLDTGQVVGYEALARGPAGSRLASPKALFKLAYETDRVAELDWVCRAAAFRVALGADLPHSVALFINVEPRALGEPCPADVLPIIETAAERLRVVIEVTERAIGHDPATLLAALASARKESTGLALNDLGVDLTTLAVMPLVGPDVIKYDLRVVQDQTSPEVARIVGAVLAEAEMTGAMILAEGVESERHVPIARAMGATLAQGWHFGRPGPLPQHLPEPTRPIVFLPLWPDSGLSPFEAVSRRRRSSLTIKELLVPMSMYLEYRVLAVDIPIVLLACFQHARHFDPATRNRYAQLAERALFVAALGQDMPREPAPGVRGGQLSPDDPLTRQWVLTVIGPHYAGALLARDRGDSAPELARSFDFIITHDRRLVIEAAKPLIQRLLPASS